jgi:hypothetical protein
LYIDFILGEKLQFFIAVHCIEFIMSTEKMNIVDEASDSDQVPVLVEVTDSESVPVPRLYNYVGDVLVFNESFGGDGFATLLNRIHGLYTRSV